MIFNKLIIIDQCSNPVYCARGVVWLKGHMYVSLKFIHATHTNLNN